MPHEAAICCRQSRDFFDLKRRQVSTGIADTDLFNYHTDTLDIVLMHLGHTFFPLNSMRSSEL